MGNNLKDNFIPYPEYKRQTRLGIGYILLDIKEWFKCQFHRRYWLIDIKTDRYDDKFKCLKCNRAWVKTYYVI